MLCAVARLYRIMYAHVDTKRLQFVRYAPLTDLGGGSTTVTVSRCERASKISTDVVRGTERPRTRKRTIVMRAAGTQ